MTTTIGVGIDVSKDKLDVALHTGEVLGTIAQDAEAMEQLATTLKSIAPHRVVVEATGGYERPLLAVLHAEGLPVVLIEPARARYFARSRGRRAKTDAIDAHLLAVMAAGEVDDEELWTPKEPALAELTEMVIRRQQIVQQIGDEQRRQKQLPEGHAKRSVRRTLDFLSGEKKRLEKDINEQIKGHEDLKQTSAVLESVKGVGRTTAAVMMSLMPELGDLDRRSVAALFGVAPYTCESGQFRGAQRVQGGRRRPRQLLYMATVVAIRHNAVIRAHYAHLLAKGKKKKVAIVACMRKMAIHLNSLMRQHRQRLEQAA